MLDQTIACFASDPDDWDVRAAAVLHLDRRLLPNDVEEIAAREAAERGDPFEGVPSYVIYKMAFNEDDRVPLYMDGDPACLVHEVGTADEEPPALSEARAWAGSGGKEYEFEHLPGVYQAAYLSSVRGTPVDSDPTQFMWAIPGDGDLVPVREFPPRNGPTDMTPEPGTVAWSLLPRSAIDELLARRGWR
jgi:hypothetical protein